MAYLNNKWFENEIKMHGGVSEICIETGYEKELLFARHAPPNGIYWLYRNYCNPQQTNDYGPNESWILVEVGENIGPLRTIYLLFGDRIEPSWYDFTQAHWRGPVGLPPEPIDKPSTAANRR